MNVGEGLTFFNNKLKVDFEDPSLVLYDSGGAIIFPDLSQTPRELGTIDCDSWTTTSDGDRGINIDRNHIPLNYGMYAYEVDDRETPTSTTLKTKSDVIAEINLALLNSEPTPYDLMVGDLITFRQNYRNRNDPLYTTLVDDGLRYKSDICLALFTVEGITKSGASISTVTDITLRCLYSSPTTTAGGWSKNMVLI